MADNDKVPDGRMEPRCAAWQTWQVVSCCPFWWVWVAVWVRNTTNSTARVKVNTLVQFPMVFPLKAINHFNTASDWTRRPSHSNRNFVSFEAISESVPHGVLISGLDKWLENESHFRMGKSCSG